ncbi:hypothetical protein E2C01_000050 [Portunus trituberculatus]|uniref:Uncharacterized protein n=1 Tax=Portunus trituberculatus TaxID=210409 RepID=A0A5B7CD61_PORTR|nr:hypothetical protein [Portunus trituberculatus]
MVLEAERQDLYIINSRNTLKNPASHPCGFGKQSWWENKTFLNMDLSPTQTFPHQHQPRDTHHDGVGVMHHIQEGKIQHQRHLVQHNDSLHGPASHCQPCHNTTPPLSTL